MAENVIKISASGLPDIFPTGWIDKMYTYFRTTPNGLWEQEFITDGKFQVVNDPFFDERRIQSILYNKYLLRIHASENNNLDLWKFADNFAVLDKDQVTHKCKILDWEWERVDNTDLRLYTISYADINVDNYADQKEPKVNYLVWPTPLDEFTIPQLLRFQISEALTIDAEWTSYQSTYTVYSKLVPKFSVTDTEEEDGELDKLKQVTRGTVQRVLEGRFYLSRTDANVIKKYSQLVGTTRLLWSSATYTAVERVIPEIKEVEGASDIFECNVKLKYNNLDFYPLNN